MRLFSEGDKVFDVIEANYLLLPVLNRFGITLGVKEKTIANICAEHQINIDFFLAVINTYNQPDYFPETQLLKFPPLLLVDYLRKTHSYYLEFLLPKIEQLLKQLIDNCGRDTDNLRMIQTFYHKYKKELVLHIQDEEKNVFPYIKKLIENPGQLEKGYSIHSFEKEHSNVEVKLGDLKRLVIKYLEPNYNFYDINEFLAMLYRFERDIGDHARIEDKILIPVVVELEKQLKA